MAFQIAPTGLRKPVALPPGIASLHKSGLLSMHPDDLRRLCIADRVTILVDPDRLRVGVRHPREDEVSRRVTRAGPRRIVTVARAVQGLGMAPRAVAGRYNLVIDEREAIGFIELQEPDEVGGDQPQRPSRSHAADRAGPAQFDPTPAKTE